MLTGFDDAVVVVAFKEKEVFSVLVGSDDSEAGKVVTSTAESVPETTPEKTSVIVLVDVQNEVRIPVDTFLSSRVLLSTGVKIGLGGPSEDEIVIVPAEGSDVAVIPPAASLLSVTDELSSPLVGLSSAGVSVGMKRTNVLSPAGLSVVVNGSTSAPSLDPLGTVGTGVTTASFGGVETSTTALFGGPSTCACRRWTCRRTWPFLPAAAPRVRNPRR